MKIKLLVSRGAPERESYGQTLSGTDDDAAVHAAVSRVVPWIQFNGDAPIVIRVYREGDHGAGWIVVRENIDGRRTGRCYRNVYASDECYRLRDAAEYDDATLDGVPLQVEAGKSRWDAAYCWRLDTREPFGFIWREDLVPL